MPQDPTPTPSQRNTFGTTQWSLVVQAGNLQSEQSREALEKLCRNYWRPLFDFARHSGKNRDDAQDATQGFFSHILSNNSLHIADPARGRFRSFLLTAFQNYMRSERTRANAQKRGGNVQHIALDETDNNKPGPDKLEHDILKNDKNLVEKGTPEEAYDQQWAFTTYENAIKALKQQYADEGKAALYAHLQPHLVGCSNADCARIAAELQTTPGNIATSLSRFRNRLNKAIRQEVEQTVSRFEDVEDEMRYLRELLSRRGM